MQQEVVLSHKLLEHVYEQENPFRLKEDNPLQKKNCNHLSHPSSFHIDQEFQENLIQWKIYILLNLNENLKY